jgi:hypothetical protein
VKKFIMEVLFWLGVVVLVVVVLPYTAIVGVAFVALLAVFAVLGGIVELVRWVLR